MSRSVRRRHARSREPRRHWRLLALTLSVVLAALLFEGWTVHEVDAAKSRLPCARPAPEAVNESGPVLRHIGADGDVKSSAMPARIVALTYDGGPDPYWTPRLLDLLRRHHARATFFLYGAQAARHPELVRRIVDEGHEIGSNTYTGADLGSSSRVRTAMELALTHAEPRPLPGPLHAAPGGGESRAARREDRDVAASPIPGRTAIVGGGAEL
ncbi:polysaccharide deacetylase family protein [Streptomyces chartreusis]|uniref:polysaccharide deacetylase family protein n=1 Tax=Streptomyces chartreusis TaxID=1969 RepID=UPI003626D724